MEEVGCAICGRHSDDIAIEEAGFTGRRCPSCGLIYVSPRPSHETMIARYASDSAHLSAESHIVTEHSRRLLARRNLRAIRSYAGGGELLEIGSGAGYFLDEARRLGFSPHGLEPNPVLVEYAVKELDIPCRRSQLEGETLGTAAFDVIYHCDVLSHLYDPLSDLVAMHRALRDDGVMAFETGNIADVSERHLGLITSFQYPDHLCFFGLKSLSLILDRAGFSMEGLIACSIVPQLLITRALGALLAREGPSGGGRDPERVPPSDATLDPPRLRVKRAPTWAGSSTLAVQSAKHFLRYGIGRVAPRHGRPQTLFVVAKKKH